MATEQSSEESERSWGARRAEGPLAGLRVIELAGLGPGPFCAMVLADLGAEVIRVERAGMPAASVGSVDRRQVLTRGRPALGVDLKSEKGIELVLRMVEHADVLLEGFRPGVLERLGLAPTVCLRRNPRLIYGRITGYGQDGALAAEAGHDINFISIAGALAPIGRRGEAPLPPLNLVADFGGGGMLLAMGVLAAVYERTRSGLGQVVDAAMVDGAALLTTMFHQMRALSVWHDERGTNSMDTGSHYYNVYETSDGGSFSPSGPWNRTSTIRS
jgi:alpha-methylacyl-CoA racemase